MDIDNITSTSNIPADSTSQLTVTPTNNRKIVYITVFVLLVTIIPALGIGAIAIRNNSQSANFSTSQTTFSGVTFSTTSTISRSSTAGFIQEYVLKTQLLGSEDFSEMITTLSIANGVGTSVTFQDDTAIVLQRDGNYLAFQTTSENTGTLYESRLNATLVDANNLSGPVYRIVLQDQAAINHYQQRFDLPSTTNWQYYSNTYKEERCGQLFGPATNSYSTAPACGGNSIEVEQGILSSSIETYCISPANTMSFCDDIIKELNITLR